MINVKIFWKNFSKRPKFTLKLQKNRDFWKFYAMSDCGNMVNNVRGRPCVAFQNQGFDGHESEWRHLSSNGIRLAFYGSDFLADKYCK